MPTPSAHAPRLPHLPSPVRSEWGDLLELVPSSFELMSTRSLARQGFELFTNAANSRRFFAVLARLQSQLRASSIPVLVEGHRSAPKLLGHEQLSRSQRRWIGQLALEVYFTQVFRSEDAILDFWPSRFGVDGSGDALWAPRPFYLRWDPVFREGVRDVYAGFFLGDDARFQGGVRQLGLGEASQALVAHFGAGNQRSVRFDVQALGTTLEALARTPSSSDTRLHPNFAALGVSLVALYNLLGSLDMAYDVRTAFMRVYGDDRSKR